MGELLLRTLFWKYGTILKIVSFTAAKNDVRYIYMAFRIHLQISSLLSMMSWKFSLPARTSVCIRHLTLCVSFAAELNIKCQTYIFTFIRQPGWSGCGSRSGYGLASRSCYPSAILYDDYETEALSPMKPETMRMLYTPQKKWTEDIQFAHNMSCPPLFLISETDISQFDFI